MEPVAPPFASPSAAARPSAGSIPDLTRRLSGGEEAAFEEFHALYFDRIYEFALVLSRGDEHESRAITQDTLLRVARRARAFSDEAAFWNWLKAIARNSARDGGRKRLRYFSLLRRFSFQWNAPTLPPDAAEENRLPVLLEESLHELEPGERELLCAKYLRGASVKQLSAESGLTPKAVESRLLRLRRALRNTILRKLRDPETRP